MNRLADFVGAPAAPAYSRGVAIDEAFGPDGSARRHYAELIDSLRQSDLGDLSQAVRSASVRQRVEFGRESRRGIFPFDPVPRIFGAAEWRLLSDGLTQRARALNAFLADVYGEQRILGAGVVPPWLLDGAFFFETDLVGFPEAVVAHMGGTDVVRAPDGELLVLEDNVRTPSGAAYLLAARRICDPLLPLGPPPERLALGAHLKSLLADTLRAAAPPERDPVIVLLSDGIANSAWWEHRELSRLIGIPLVEPHDLRRIGNRLHARVRGRMLPVDVVYRRTDNSRLRDPDGQLSWLGEAMLAPLQAGKLACVNSFGTGVADDKLVHAHVEEMIHFYLGEQPLLRSVPTYDPRHPDQRTAILERIDELVVKPRDGFGGTGVIICPHAQTSDVLRARNLIATQAAHVVAQEMIELSTCPTVRDGSLVPRHVDLRAMVYMTGDGPRVLPGGLTRVAFDPGSLVVNSSQSGGGKDTWVLG